MRIEEPAFQRLVFTCASRIELWRRVLSSIQARQVVEIGVWKGEYAEQILTGCPFIERYYMIDPWDQLPDWNKPFNVAPEAFAEVHREALRRTDFASSKRVVLRGRTKEVIGEIPDGSLDFGYVDGDHTLRGITIDLIQLLPKMREGGLIGGDDFVRQPWQHGSAHEPTLVFPFSVYFAEAMNLPIVALPFNQFVLQKRADSRFTFVDTTGLYAELSLRSLVGAAFPDPVL